MFSRGIESVQCGMEWVKKWFDLFVLFFLFRTRVEWDGHERQYYVSDIKVYYDYKNGIKHDNDIGLVKLDKPAMFNNYVGSVCFPENDYRVGENCYISGMSLLQLSSINSCRNRIHKKGNFCQVKLKTYFIYSLK